MIYWLYLLLAIFAEIIGTLSMKYASLTGELSGHVVMYVMISASYFVLSKAVQKIDLGVAYALWEGAGLLLITLFSIMLFDEPISLLKAFGLVVLLAGITLVKSGTSEKAGEKRATA